MQVAGAPPCVMVASTNVRHEIGKTGLWTKGRGMKFSRYIAFLVQP